MEWAMRQGLLAGTVGDSGPSRRAGLTQDRGGVSADDPLITVRSSFESRRAIQKSQKLTAVMGVSPRAAVGIPR